MLRGTGSRPLIIAVAFTALALTVDRWLMGQSPSLGWWDIRACLNLVLLPLITWGHASMARIRRLERAICLCCVLMLFLWMELRRPRLMGPFFGSPADLVRCWLGPARHLNGYQFEWLVEYGTAIDAISLIYPLLEIPLVTRCRASGRFLLISAIPLWMIRTVDWAVSGSAHHGFGTTTHLRFDVAPIRLLIHVLAGRLSIGSALRLVGPMRICELIFVCLTAGWIASPRTWRRGPYAQANWVRHICRQQMSVFGEPTKLEA